MALFSEFKPALSEIARYLRVIATKDCCSAAPSAGTEATANPNTLSSGFSYIKIRKTNASGTVTITLPDASTYVLSADGEEFELSGGGKLGEFSINAAGGATYKYITS